jgi:hypothetical protein
MVRKRRSALPPGLLVVFTVTVFALWNVEARQLFPLAGLVGCWWCVVRS